MPKIQTVKVKAPDGGFMIINECDLEGSEYVRFQEEKKETKATTKKVAAKKKAAK